MRKFLNMSSAVLTCTVIALTFVISSMSLMSCLPTGISPDITSTDNSSDGDSENTGQNIPNVQVVEGRQIDSFNETELVFNMASEGISLSEGDIIASGPIPLAPDGFLLKVVSINQIGDKIDITVEPVSIEQAISNGEINISGTLTSAELDAIQSANSKLNSDFDINLDNVVIYDTDGNSETTGDRITVSGYITIIPTFELTIKIENHQLVYLKFLTNIRFDTRLDVSVGANVPEEAFENAVTLDAFRFKPIQVTVDSIPVVIRPIMSLIVGTSGQNADNMHTISSLKGTYQAGTIYQDGTYRHISNFTTDFDADDSPQQVTQDGKLKAYSAVKLNLLVYGIEGLESKLYEYSQLISDMSSVPWWNIFGGLQADIKITNKPISDTVKDYSCFIDSFRKVLSSAQIQIATPTFDPSSGTFTDSVNVTISCPTAGASIYYTTDGSDPDESSTLYNGPIAITQTTTIKAKAYKQGMTASDIASATYTIVAPPPPQKVATPAFDPSSGTFTDSVNVTISCPTAGASIYYTTDGSDPDESSVLYNGQIAITQTTTIKARAYKQGMIASDIASATYTKREIPLWAKSAGGNSDEVGYGIAYCSDGSVIVVGTFTGSSVFGKSQSNQTTLIADGSTDIFIAKYDSDGQLLWVKHSPGSGNDIATSIAIFSDDSFIVTGSFDGNITFGRGESNETSFQTSLGADVFLARYNADGTLAWASVISCNESYNLGTSIAALPDGSFVVVGKFHNEITLGGGTSNAISLDSPNAFDIFVARYDSSGTPIWALKAGDDYLDDAAYDVAYSNGYVFVTGYFQGSATFYNEYTLPITVTSEGGQDVFIAKYYYDGSLLWVKTAGGDANDTGYALDASSDGSIAVTGAFSSSVAVFGKYEDYETGLTNKGAEDIFVAKYNNDGTLNWATSAGGASSEIGRDIKTLNDSSLVVIGEFTGNAVFGKASSQTTLTSFGQNDIFIARFAATNGDSLWAKQAGSDAEDAGLSLAIFSDSTGIQYLETTGYFSSSATFGFGETNQVTLVSEGGKDVFITQYKDDGTVREILNNDGLITSPQ